MARVSRLVGVRSRRALLLHFAINNTYSRRLGNLSAQNASSFRNNALRSVARRHRRTRRAVAADVRDDTKKRTQGPVRIAKRLGLGATLTAVHSPKSAKNSPPPDQAHLSVGKRPQAA
uniref:Histone H1 n=1 Tax=Ascaris lumbricoides TaxID=6252 RepID=A0A0M3HP16_ASCLU